MSQVIEIEDGRVELALRARAESLGFRLECERHLNAGAAGRGVYALVNSRSGPILEDVDLDQIQSFLDSAAARFDRAA